MATNRKRTPRSRQVQTLHPSAVCWLYDRPEPCDNHWIDYIFMWDDELKKFWMDNRDEVLAWWIKNRPGTRPSNWWLFEAPEQPIKGESQGEYLQRHGLLAKGEKIGPQGPIIDWWGVEVHYYNIPLKIMC